MTRYVQGPRHAQRGPYRSILLPLTFLVALLAAAVAAVVWLVVV